MQQKAKKAGEAQEAPKPHPLSKMNNTSWRNARAGGQEVGGAPQGARAGGILAAARARSEHTFGRHLRELANLIAAAEKASEDGASRNSPPTTFLRRRAG